MEASAALFQRDGNEVQVDRSLGGLETKLPKSSPNGYGTATLMEALNRRRSTDSGKRNTRYPISGANVQKAARGVTNGQERRGNSPQLRPPHPNLARKLPDWAIMCYLARLDDTAHL